MTVLEQATKFLYTKQEEERLLEEALARHTTLAVKFTDDSDEYQTALDVLSEAVTLTHDEARKMLEELTTDALRAVYGDEYSFRLDYGTVRDRTGVTPIILRGNTEVSPKDEVGGGVIDVASFALRLGCWILQDPQPSAVFFLDEPFRFVSSDRIGNVVSLLLGICDLLGVQLNVVSHNTELIAAGESAFEVSNEAGKSMVKKVR